MNLSDSARAPLVVSVREVRMTLDRIFLAAGVPAGMVTAVREHALISAALGLGGLAMVQARHAKIGAAAAVVPTLMDGGGGGALTIDARGQHAWLAGATVLDIAVAHAQMSGQATVILRNVVCAQELQVLAVLACRHGARAVVTVTGDPLLATADATLEVTICATSRSPAEWDPVLSAALRTGFPVDTALWWDLHRLSNRALSPDTVESRRHAGPIIVAEDGRIIGRPVDDDTDVSLLQRAAG